MRALKNMKQRILTVALTLFSMSVIAPVAAQSTFPAKPARIIVPYPAGGSLDTIARAVAQELSTQWKQPVVVENRGGASGMIGTEAVAKAAADGYTILFSASSEVGMNVALFPTMSYDPLKDLAPVTLLARTPVALLTHPSSPVRNVAGLLQAAKSGAGVPYATPGIATPQHFAGELLKSRTHANLVHVPYKGAAPMINDMLAGHITVGFLALPSVMPHIRAGRLNVVALTSAERSTLLPDVPTVAESGVPQFEIGQWLAVFVPGATPPAVIQKINADIVAIIKTPAFTQRLQEMGAEVVGSSPEVLRKTQENDIATYRSVAAAAKIKPE